MSKKPISRLESRSRVAIAVLLMGGAGTASCGVHRLPHLNLVEESFLAVPDSFVVIGAAIRRDGSLVLWARNQPYLIVSRGDSTSQVRVAGVLRPTAVSWSDSNLVVLDGAGHSVTIANLTGEVKSRRTFTEPKIVESAALSGTWYVVGRSGKTRRLYQLNDQTGTTLASQPVPRFDGPLRDAIEKQSWVVCGGRGDIILSSVRRPFRAWSIMSRAQRAEGFQQKRLRMPNADSTDWVALHVVGIDSGFVQTISSLKSDHRVLALFDAAGGLQRQIVLDAPFGVIAADAYRRELIAERFVNRQEIVRYKWEWGSPTAVQ